MARICEISGKYTRSGNRVSHANNKTKRRFYPNLQTKRFYVPELGTYIRMKVATSVLRTINKNGLLPTLRKAQKGGTLHSDLQLLASVLR